jgi:CheY-like chemotaxis protein
MSNKTILVLEDNIDYQELIRLAFEQCDLEHELVLVSDGFEILNYLFGQDRRDFPLEERSFFPPPDNLSEQETPRDLNEMPRVILLDLDVPRISGLEVLQHIRANPRTKYIPVVITSTSTEPEELVSSYSYGCNSYVRKPVDFTELQNFVREITAYWLTINQVPPVFGELDE